MKKLLLLGILFLSTQMSAQIVDIPDTNFKNALLNHDPVIDTNGDDEIQVTEAEAFAGYMNVSGKDIISMSGLDAFSNLVGLTCSYNDITTLDIGLNLLLETLICGNNDITTLALGNLGNLEILRAERNELTSLDLSGLTNLDYLSVSGNNLTAIDVSDNQNINYLNVTANYLSNLDVTNNAALLRLYCSGNNLTSLDVSQNPELGRLSAGNNDITEIDISQNPDLVELSLSFLDLSSLDLSLSTDLIQLSLIGATIPELNLNDLVNLESLYIGGTNLESIDLSGNPNLEHLQADNGSLQSVDISANPNMKLLRLENLNLSSIDLSNNLALQGIDLIGNNFSNFDFSFLQDLIWVILDENPIESVDLSQNPNLCGFLARECPLLTSVNLSNGNNESLVYGESCSFEVGFENLAGASGVFLDENPLLELICVDDLEYATNNFEQVQDNVTYVEDCSILGSETNSIEGDIVFDTENDGCDGDDIKLASMMIHSTDGSNNFATSSNADGFYQLSVVENDYTTSVIGLPTYFTTDPTQSDNSFVGFNQTQVANFCVQALEMVDDLEISMIPIFDARPGFEATYKIIYQNVGSTELSGNVILSFNDAKLSFVESTPAENDLTANSIGWEYANMLPFEVRSIDLVMQVFAPPIVEGGDILAYTASITPDSNDATPENNSFDFNQEVVNSFDPNDKKVVEGHQVLIENSDKYLHYILRFQNTGTASAINVKVKDPLEEKLDWTTFQLLDVSHDVRVEYLNGTLDFVFDNINLPHEGADPEGSNGYIIFKIKPVSGIQIGDTIENTGYIYFDFNPPIVTNTVATAYVDILDVENQQVAEVALYPNPAGDHFTIQSAEIVESVSIFSVSGQLILNETPRSVNFQIDSSKFQSGVYFVNVQTESGQQVFRLLKE